MLLRFKINSVVIFRENSTIPVWFSTVYLKFGRFGGNPIIAGFSKERLQDTQSKVSFVAVAVKAKFFTELGIRLRMLPISANALRNFFP